MNSGKLENLIVAGALFTLPAWSQSKGRMVLGPIVNSGAQVSTEMTRGTARQLASVRTTDLQPILIITPWDNGGGGDGGGGGGGGTGGGPIDTGGGIGTGTGTGTGTGSGGTTTTTPAGSIPADSLWASILAQNPGDTTPGYPYTPNGALDTYKGPSATSDPALTDLTVDMANVTGIGGSDTTNSGPTNPGCVCCGAVVHTELIHDVTAVKVQVEAYVAYQVWHVDHYSGNFWDSYHHSNNVCTGTTMLGDINGFEMPPGTAPIPMAYSGAVGCTVPWGTSVALTEGPAMPSPFSNPPTICPQCGRHDDSWGVYPVGVYKVKITLPVISTVAQDRWAVLCANGHDQALPCDGNGLPPAPTGGTGTGTGGTGTGGGHVIWKYQ